MLFPSETCSSSGSPSSNDLSTPPALPPLPLPPTVVGMWQTWPWPPHRGGSPRPEPYRLLHPKWPSAGLSGQSQSIYPRASLSLPSSEPPSSQHLILALYLLLILGASSAATLLSLWTGSHAPFPSSSRISSPGCPSPAASADGLVSSLPFIIFYFLSSPAYATGCPQFCLARSGNSSWVTGRFSWLSCPGWDHRAGFSAPWCHVCRCFTQWEGF